MTENIKDKKINSSAPNAFTKGNTCLINLINIYGEMTGLIEEARAVNIVCLDFSKTFDTVSHKISETNC